jgi:signal transduction histidine kinase
VRAVVNFRDVTADRQDRDALLSFAGVVAHDLFNPLTVIHGWAHSLDDAFDDGPVAPQDGKAMVARITSASLHMRGFIDDLLSYTVARDAELSTERLDLSAIAEEMAGMHRDGSTRPRIRVQPGLRATGDPVLVRQLLGNLIGNAVKYVGPEVRPDIEVLATSGEGWVHVSVIDNGIGVPVEKRERIFDNFQRAHTDGYAGTGIGLAICRRVVERHGGVIAVVDAPDRTGSVFTFTLPA